MDLFKYILIFAKNLGLTTSPHDIAASGSELKVKSELACGLYVDEAPKRLNQLNETLRERERRRNSGIKDPKPSTNWKNAYTKYKQLAILIAEKEYETETLDDEDSRLASMKNDIQELNIELMNVAFPENLGILRSSGKYPSRNNREESPAFVEIRGDDSAVQLEGVSLIGDDDGEECYTLGVDPDAFFYEEPEHQEALLWQKLGIGIY